MSSLKYSKRSNRRHYWRYHAAFATSLLFCLAFPATAQAEKIKGTIVEQKTTKFGLTTLYLCDKGARIEFSSDTFPFTCVTSAPDFKPIVYSKQKKLMHVAPLDDWSSRCPHLPKETLEFGKEVKRTEAWQGKMARRVTLDIKRSDPLKERVEFFYQDAHKRSMSFDKLEMVYGLWFNVQPKIKPFLFGFYRLPSMTGLPLEALHRYPDHSSDYILKTTKLTEATFDSKDFLPPPGFKVTPNFKEILDEGKQRKMLPGVLEDILVPSDRGK